MDALPIVRASRRDAGAARGIALGAVALVALLWLALVNGYPLLNYDSGTHLDTAATLRVPVDRPVVYSWFIRGTSLDASPWLVVVAQAAIAFSVMKRVLRVIDPTASRTEDALCIVATAALSSAPYFVGQVLPDFFSGVLPLAIFLLATGGAVPTIVERCALFLLIVIGVAAHTSHLVIALACAGALAMARLLFARSVAGASGTPLSFAGLGLAALATCVAGLVVSATNYAQFGRFVVSPASHVFLMGRLLADGPAARHLQRACPQAGYRLCAFVDRLPRDEIEYIWGGVLREQTGDWLDSREESWLIIGRTVAEEPGAVIANALINTARQLVANRTLRITTIIPLDHGTLRTLARLYPEDRERFARSLQQRGELQSAAFRLYSQMLRIVFACAVIAACVLAWRRRATEPAALYLVVACFAFFAANAFVCSALSAVIDRYQSRVSWPVVFTGIALVASWVRARRQQARRR